MMLAFVCVALIAAGFAWQIRNEKDKFLYFLLGIGVGCAMAAVLTH